MIIRATQRKDVAPGDEHIRRVEGRELGRLRGPAERRKRPERAREPGIEDVLVLAHRSAAGAAALGRRGGNVGLLAGVAVVDRQAVAPPQLARDAPGADPLHPVEVDAGPALGEEADPAVVDSVDRGLREVVHAHEPLQRNERLDTSPGAVRVRNFVSERVARAQEAFGFQRRDDGRLGLGDRQTREASRLRVHPPVLADHRDHRQVVAAADLEVVGVMPRRDLQRTGTELRLHIVVGDDRQASPNERQDREPPDQVRVALVVGVHGDSHVTQHRLRPHGCHDDLRVFVLDCVSNREQRVRLRPLLDLEVGDRRARARVPVDEIVVAVDVAALVELDEHLHDRRRVGLIEREALLVVVERCAELLEAFDDVAAVELAPGPHALLEALAPELFARASLAAELALDLDLRRDPGVICAEDELRALTALARGADQRVLGRRLERVAHVQVAGDVRRRERDRVVLARDRVRMEDSRGEPRRRQARLDLARVEARAGAQFFQRRTGHLGRRLQRRERPSNPWQDKVRWWRVLVLGAGFDTPADLTHNRGLIADPVAFAREAGAASWLFLCGEEFAGMEGGISFAAVQAAVPQAANVVSDPPRVMDMELARAQIAALDALPRPTLVTCRTGPRSSALVYLYAGLRSGAKADEVLARAEADDAPFTHADDLKAWLLQGLDELA